MAVLRILATNDDGIDAPGLNSLVQELGRTAEVYVAAPSSEQSATGHAITMRRPLRVSEKKMEGAREAYAVNGTPADCVKMAVDALFPAGFDLVVSGINRGANLGTDVLYSGTVSAALEGVMLGLPAIAFSLTDYCDTNFQMAAKLASELVVALWSKPWPQDTMYNINIPPAFACDPPQLRVTALGRLFYANPVATRQDPRGNTYYWLAGELATDGHSEPTDIWAVQEGHISLTPIHFDLTNHALLDTVAAWNLQLTHREDK